jgi:tetratricopeptide (TPR) repeat protein
MTSLICKQPVLCSFLSNKIVLFLFALCISATRVTDCASAYNCPKTFIAKLGASVPEMEKTARDSLSDFKPNLGAIPKEVADTAQENIPEYERNFALDPKASARLLVADIYFGKEYKSTNPDVFSLSSDPRLLCILSPAQGVFLSDGVTNHYAVIRHIDYAAGKIVLIDPWSSKSFLLQGRNLAGVAGRPLHPPGEPEQLELSFGDFLRVDKGLMNPAATTDGFFDIVASLYPETSGTDEFLFWKFSRRLMALNSGAATAALVDFLVEAQHRPALRTLRDYATDVSIRVASGFEVNGPGQVNNATDVASARSAFLARLPVYAKALPWRLKWNLVEVAAAAHDYVLTMDIADAFLKETSDDANFQIEKANALLRQHNVDGALKQYDAAEIAWKAAVGATIDIKPVENAVAYYFAHLSALSGMLTFEDLERARVRIALGRIAARLTDHIKFDPVAELRVLRDEAPFDVNIDYFPEMIEINWLWQGRQLATQYTQLMLGRFSKDWDGDTFVHIRIAEALYAHLATRQSIKDFVKADRNFPDDALLHDMLCAKARGEFLAEGPLIVCTSCDLRDAVSSLRSDLMNYCK